MVGWPYGAVETAPIDERDIAAVAVRALSEASLAGGDYVLTGPAALSHARQVAVIGEVLGRRLAFHELSPEEFRRDGRQLAEARRRYVARRVGSGGRASRVRDHDGGRSHECARTLLPRLARRAHRQLSGCGRPTNLPAAGGVEVDREVIVDERTLPEGVDIECRTGHAVLKVRAVRVESPEHFVREKRNLGVG